MTQLLLWSTWIYFLKTLIIIIWNLIAFNLKYKSSSFIANNAVLELNFNNSAMQIKNIWNYSHFDLNYYQFEKKKEKDYDFLE